MLEKDAIIEAKNHNGKCFFKEPGHKIPWLELC